MDDQGFYEKLEPAPLKLYPADRPIPVAGQDGSGGRQPDRQPRRPPPEEEAKDHFAELARAAEAAHRKLELKKSPYRFCVYRVGDQVFIDLLLLGPDGKSREVKAKNITHDKFARWLTHIEQGEGLFFDDQG